MSDADDLDFLRQHSAHDVEGLMRRWSALADRHSFQRQVLGTDADQEVIALETSASLEGPCIYLSAGVHGDEPAPLWGLLLWAEANLERWLKRGVQFLIFPCFNPHGVVENTRRDSEDRDLNRCFEDPSLPLMKAWQKLIEGRTFSLSLQLHEDYDGRGVYIYDLDRLSEDHALTRRCLDACDPILPRDWRNEIDDSEFEGGILQRGIDEVDLREVVDEELDGWPEAIYLFLNHCPQTLTFETPSEFTLTTRIRAHQCLIETAINEVVGV